MRIDCLFCLLLSCLNFPFTRCPAEDLNTLQSKVEQLISIPQLADASVGIRFVRLSDGKTVLDVNPSSKLILASNTKLITTGVALVILGKEYQFPTLVWTDGSIEAGGVLKGDLIVQGSGDPNISGRFESSPTAIFERWADILRKKGVKKIEGNLIGDDTAFDREWSNPNWPEEQLTSWYCAQVSALTFNDNCIDYTVRPGTKIGHSLQVITSPATSYQMTRNISKTKGAVSRSAIWFNRPKNSNRVTVGGSHPAGGLPFTEPITVHNPSLFFVHVLHETLVRKGIEITGKPVLTDKPLDPLRGGRSVESFTSPLLDTLRITNKRSQNLFAEVLLKALGRHVHGHGTRTNGLSAVTAVLKEAGVNDGIELFDGSGLARGNLMSPDQMTQWLFWLRKQPIGGAFRGTLAIAGVDGTLSERFGTSPLKGKLFAKTGYLNKVSTLSGYMSAQAGEEFVFSILFNNFRGSNAVMKSVQEQICEAAYAGE